MNDQTSYDLDAVLAADSSPDTQITFKVGVIFDLDGNAVSGFEIVSRNSEQYRAADKAINIVNRKASASRTKEIDQKTDAGAARVNSVVDEQNITRCAAVTVGWFGWTKKGDDGKPVERPFDAAAMPVILKQKKTWVEKIQFAMFEDNNFLPSLPDTSAPTPSSN